MSVTQKMFTYSGFMLVAILAVFARAVPVPVSEEVQPAQYNQFVSTQVMADSANEPMLSVYRTVQVDPVAVRPVRSASPFLGIFGGYERPYKSQKQHHHHHQEEHGYEPEYHHRPQHHKPQYHHHHQEPHHHHHQEPHYHHQEPQHHGGGGAGSYASAGSFSGGHGGGHSQSGANSQSASFGFGPFQASYSASSAQSGSHSNRGFSDY
ncbi:protein disconnected-like [Rhopalosiphum padi]|uniref:protein disconnected-like n=1 Tax=Rhopalosiphum padi TaxID=40932 RepID=UPI00298DC758|nr:protein disconnected-like [Rhopalosiphum padi]